MLGWRGKDEHEDDWDFWSGHVDFFGMLCVLASMLGFVRCYQVVVLGAPTFKPMHLMVPTSCWVNGASSLSIFSTLSVREPGLRADVPLNTFASTVFPSWRASPTSTSLSTGSPSRTAFGSLAGTKRTRRPKDMIAIEFDGVFVGYREL